MNKLLIINSHQFGYLIDTYKYCECLKDLFEITYLCYDKGYEKLCIDNIRVIYIKHGKRKLIRSLKFLFRAIALCIFNRGIIFVVYFPGVEVLKRLMPWKRMHLDIRSLSVSPDENIRYRFNQDLHRTAELFDSVSAISKGVINKIASHRDIKLLPLGADTISENVKCFDKLRLLYVGTLFNRDIIKTVIGVKRFLEKNPYADIHYDIIGDGEPEFNEISEYISMNSLASHITLHGRLPYTRLKPFFEGNNIGVSFVPITEYYRHQPPTKTFEYSLSGLYTIATGTEANMEVISPVNGCIINDTPEDFCMAIENIEKNKKQYDSKLIRLSLENYEWGKIVQNYLMPILEDVNKIY